MNNTESTPIDFISIDELNGIDLLLELTGLNQETFIIKGIEHIVSIEKDFVFNHYEQLIDEIEAKNTIFIRTYGRGNTAGKREEYERFLRFVLDNPTATISLDKTNNANPSRQFNKYPGIDRKKFKNYRLSHVWDGMTKNPYAFCALWNMCLTPFFIDPLTGHETKHDLSKNFSKALQNYIYKIHKNSIQLYNEKMEKLAAKVDEFINDPTNFKNFSKQEKKAIKANFRTIEITL